MNQEKGAEHRRGSDLGQFLVKWGKGGTKENLSQLSDITN